MHPQRRPHNGTRPAHDRPGTPPQGVPLREGLRPDQGGRRLKNMSETPNAECVLCREPTEYPATQKGITLCPVCEWQEAQRSACSG
ncbi:hypothetical protein [Streptomyces acidiscabies]|uniref:hypothetical protein n=1 Tax=Streptomyces acidiscabies TaxID=42234 RepID=UPI00351B7947